MIILCGRAERGLTPRSAPIRLPQKSFHLVLDCLREEVALDRRDASGRLSWDDINAYDTAIGPRPVHRNLYT